MKYLPKARQLVMVSTFMIVMLAGCGWNDTPQPPATPIASQQKKTNLPPSSLKTGQLTSFSLGGIAPILGQ